MDSINTSPELPATNDNKEKTSGGKRACPVACILLFCMAGLSALLHISFVLSTRFSDFMNSTVGSAVRFTLAKLTGFLPFSLAESVLICLPIAFVLMIVYSVRISRDETPRRTTRFFCILLSILSLLYTLFVLGFASAYNGSTLDTKLGMTRRDVSASELYDTALLLKKEVTALAPEISYMSDGESVMPCTGAELNERICKAYSDFCDDHSFVQKMNTRIKPLMISKLMTYTHISGVYTYYTGESNYNTNFPDYTIPYTIAHELSHQRGIAREDEANFMAFLVCAGSDDAYIRYSGYLNLFEYVTSALYKADSGLYSSVMNDLDMRIYCEMFSYNRFFEKYKDSTISKISGAVNDTYLKVQGQKEGTESYGAVVDLAVAYFVPENQ